jgi:hypothetical protein
MSEKAAAGRVEEGRRRGRCFIRYLLRHRPQSPPTYITITISIAAVQEKRQS